MNYLSILNGALIVDAFVILRVVLKQIKSKSLTEWYKKYGICSVIMDVLSIVIGILIATFIYPFLFTSYSLVYFLILAVVVQILHDLLFTVLFNLIPRGKSQIMDTFKDYGKEFGAIILVADALMIIFTIIIANFLSLQSFNTNMITCIVICYIIPYLLYSIN